MIVLKTEENGKQTLLIKSSNLLVTEYDQSTRELLVTFNNGGQYKYKDVAANDFMRLQLEESQGKAFRTYIEKKYKFDKLPTVNVEPIKEEINKLLNGK